MVVVYEFLDTEPMDNLITCMNFKVDKVVYLGFHETMKLRRKSTESFLIKYCGLQKENIDFKEVPKRNLQAILEVLRTEVGNEKKKKNQVFFDITGGESLVLVAFGMLSKETETPMHLFDVPKNKLIELEEGAEASISRDVERREVPLDLDMLIEMHGGKINHALHKDIKEIDEPEFVTDVEKIYDVAIKYWDFWNPFSDLMKKTLFPKPGSLWVSKDLEVIQNVISRSDSRLKSMKRLQAIMEDLAAVGVIKDLKKTDGKYEFRYKSEPIKDCLWEGGSILELHTCIVEQPKNDECKVGVHLDWDGEIHQQAGVDVLNEIDVLTLKGYYPSFISCKSGKMAYQQILHALYELDTIAKRFGGKYCNRILVTVSPLGQVYMDRAREMRIEVRVEGPGKASDSE